MRSGSGNGNGNMISNVNRESVHSFHLRSVCIRLQSGLMHINIREKNAHAIKVRLLYCTDLYGSNVTHNAALQMLPKSECNAQNLSFWGQVFPFRTFQGNQLLPYSPNFS
jgi:hypothetical protein